MNLIRFWYLAWTKKENVSVLTTYFIRAHVGVLFFTVFFFLFISATEVLRDNMGKEVGIPV